MARQRITPGSGLSPATGRVVANPDDPFSPFVGRGASARLEQLGRTLGDVAEQGTSFYRQQVERQRKEDARAGRQALLEALEDQQNVAEAIRKARMRPQASKWFRWGVEAEAGTQAAMRARDHFVATQGEALEEATTLEEFDRLAGEALDSFREELGGTSDAFDNGFMPAYMEQIENLRYSFATSLDGKLTQEFVDNYSATQFERLEQLHAAGELWSFTPFSQVEDEDTGSAIADFITRDLDEKTRLNPKMADALKEATVDNLILLAMDKGERTFLDLAREIRVGPEEQGESRPSLLAQYRDKFLGVNGAYREFEKLQLDRDREAETALTLADQRAYREGAYDLARVLAEGSITNPAVRRTANEVVAEVRKNNPLAADRLQGMLDRGAQAGDWTDTQVYDYLRIGISQGTVNAEHIANNAGSLTRQDLNQLLNLERVARAGAGEDVDEILTHRAVAFWQSKLDDRFTDLMDVGEGHQIAAQNALSMFRLDMIRLAPRLRELFAENPDSDEAERLIQQAANIAAVTAARDADLEFTGMLNPEGPAMTAGPAGEQESAGAPPRTVDELVGAWTMDQLASFYSYDASGELYSTDPPAEVRRLRQQWRAARPDIAIGSEEMWTILSQITAKQATGNGGE